MDDILADLRKQLVELTAKSEPSSSAQEAPVCTPDIIPAGPTDSTAKDEADYNAKKPDYNRLDVPKAKRLIQARESSIKSVRALIAKKNLPNLNPSARLEGEAFFT